MRGAWRRTKCSFPAAFSQLSAICRWWISEPKEAPPYLPSHLLAVAAFLLPRNCFAKSHGCVHGFALFVVSPHWHSPDPKFWIQPREFSYRFAAISERRYLPCWFFLPTQLVIHARITQFLYHINCSQPLEPCLTSCLDVYNKAMKFHTPPSGSSRSIHPESRTGYAKDWVWKYCQSCRAGRESWHLFYRLTGGVGKVF